MSTKLVKKSKIHSKIQQINQQVQASTQLKGDREQPGSIAKDGKTYEFKEVSKTAKVGDKDVVTVDDTNKFSDETEGTVKEGTTHVIYVYKEKQPEAPAPKGSVVVHYVNEAGEEIQDPFKDTTDQPTGTGFNTAEGDREQPGSIAKDGKTYEFKEVSKTAKVGDKDVVTVDDTNKFSDETEGTVKEGTTHVIYVYKEKQPEAPAPKGSVVVHYVNEAGEEIQDPFKDTTDQPTGTGFNTAEGDREQPGTIAKDGKTYEFKEVSKTAKVGDKDVVTVDDTNKFSDETEGTVEEGTTHVIYVYKEKQPEAPAPKGSVVVHYVNEAGEEIQDPFKDTTDQPTGTGFNTAEGDREQPGSIAKDGKTYEFKEVSKTAKVGDKDVVTVDDTNKFSDETEGTVKEGTTHVIYVYKEKQPEAPAPKGSVVVHYVNEAGEEIQDPFKDTTDQPTGTGFNTAEGDREQPGSIAKDGKTYEFKEVSKTAKVGDKDVVTVDDTNKFSDETEGTVKEGTTHVIYVYKEKQPEAPAPKGSVVVHYVNEAGEEIQDPFKDTTDQPTGTGFNTAEGDREQPGTIAKWQDL
ncbi:MucBP domain-containing protein [Streptococcus marmotae]|uniref:MucBP domain-containing protein n=1 Tax=Streptococcus marmotae TaxID=1825069 RepID=UPI000833820B|nr:MucBP domain-containing protein [Streptococcus marmotae]